MKETHMPHHERVHALREKLLDYHAAIFQTSPDEELPSTYASIQFLLGQTYQELAAHENTLANLHNAVKAYESALAHWPLDTPDMSLALSNYALGKVLVILAQQKAMPEYLPHARCALYAALDYYSVPDTPREYAQTQYLIGIAYALDGDPAALEIWREAEGIFRALNDLKQADKIATMLQKFGYGG